jgi:hypothetical protein
MDAPLFISLVYLMALSGYVLYHEWWVYRIPDSRRLKRGFKIVPHGWSAKVEPLSKIQREDDDE